MRHIKVVIVLMAASAVFVAAQIDPPSRVARLNFQEGPVSFQPSGINDWVDAEINRPLTTGDNIWVGDGGRAEFHIGSTALRLSASSAFQFLNLDDQTVQIRLSEGTLTVRLRNLAPNQIFEIDTPNLAFTLDRPGTYRIDANPDSQTTIVTVRDGEGYVTGGGQEFPVYARQRVVVRGDDQINYNLASAGGADDFDQWCSSRDRREDQSPSAQYVSREIEGYDDLDQYGRWGDQPGYGQVWMPTSVDANWAPYHDGHWAWIAPWGWTWVDEAPWGFAPYHYGRWASFGGRWGWIPGPRGVTPLYAPALVGWIGGGSGFSLSFSIGTVPAVGWFPLGPREPYFPSYRVSQGYFTRLNTTNTVINTTTINNYYSYNRDNRPVTNIQYVNRDVRNGVVAVPQNTFANGRRVTRDARPIPLAQLNSAQIVSAPAIAPRRESVLGPRADTASRAARPPANVQSRRVVARTAPPPAPVSFERQQQALSQNPGRPLAATQVQQMRQNAPPPELSVRVVDRGRLRRVQPQVGDGTQVAPPQPAPQPVVNERKNVPPGQQRQQEDAQRQERQKQQQDTQAERQQQDVQRQNAQREQQQRQRQDAERQQQQNQQQDAEQQQLRQQQQNAQREQQRQQQDAERQQQRQQQDAQRQQRVQQQEAQRQEAQRQEAQRQEAQRQEAQRQRRNAPQTQAEKPLPPAALPQNVPPGRQQPPPQEQQVHPELARPPMEQARPRAAERPERPDRGKQQRGPREDDKK